MQLLNNPGLTKGPKYLQEAAVALGNGTPIEVSSPAKGGFAILTLQVEIETTAVVTFEGTIDGVTWYSVEFVNVTDGTETATVTNAAASGIYRGNVLGLAQVRARVSTWSAGEVNVLGILVA